MTLYPGKLRVWTDGGGFTEYFAGTDVAEKFAAADGFESYVHMHFWFKSRYGNAVFHGFAFRWDWHALK